MGKNTRGLISVKMKIIYSIAFVLFLSVLPLAIPSYGLSLLMQVLIFGLFAMSLNLLVGYSGLVSFNHATFFGIGGYTVGILFSKGVENFYAAIATAIIVSALFSMVIGLLVLRNSGPYFLMLTLAFGQIVFAVAWKWRSLTGGDDGLSGISRPDIGLPVSMWDNKNFYYLVLVFFIILFVLLWKFDHSHFGKAVIGVRESESRMQALGYNTWAIKYTVYVAAGTIAGLAGSLYAFFNGFISPNELNWTTSGLGVLMVIIGGSGTLIGPLVGAGFLLILQNVLSSYTERWPLVMGILFVFCVIFAKEGITGYLNKLVDKGVKGYESFRSKGTK